MRLLLVLLSVMTWTVESKNAVSGDGTWPYDIEVHYSNSYQKGQVRAGDAAVLTLNHLEGITVEKVTVYLKSNKNAGAGEVKLAINGKQVAGKEGTFKEWFGAYDNESSHGLEMMDDPVNGVKNLEIQVTGTENSLNIEKYVIQWAPSAPHTVTLMRGPDVYGTMTEEHGMSGIALPKLKDEEVWKFAGWCNWEFWSAAPDIALYPGGKTFYPDEDCSLWAVYQYDDSPEMVYQTELKSGIYVYANSVDNKAMTGLPENGQMESVYCTTDDENQHYRIEFNTQCDTAIIQHVKTGNYIGYNGTKLAQKSSKWCVFHKDDKTAFYIHYNNKTYVLWPSMVEGMEAEHTGLQIAGNVEQATTVLIPIPVATGLDPVYTCHPESPQGVETVSGEGLNFSGEYIIPFGNYDLIIHDGQKSLRLKE